MSTVELKRMFTIGGKTLDTLISRRETAIDVDYKRRYRYSARHLENALSELEKAIEILEKS